MSHVEHAGWLGALAEAREVWRIDPIVGSQPLGNRKHVPAGDDQPVHQDHRGAAL